MVRPATPQPDRGDADQSNWRALRSPRHWGTGRVLGALLVVLALVYAIALVFLRPPAPGTQFSLDVVTRYAACGSAGGANSPDCRQLGKTIESAKFLDQDARIVGTVVSTGPDPRPQRFWASYPKSDAVTSDLLRSLAGGGTRVTVDPQTTKQLVRFVAQFLLPLVILADLFALLFFWIQGSGAAGSEFLSFGQAGDKRHHDDHKSRITFADVAAADDAVVELAEVRDYLADPTSFAEMGAVPPKGVLLFGPPGCGKTLLGRAVAGEANANFFSMSGSEFVEALVGVGAARVRDLFSQAKANVPAIIFIDEIDAVGRQRGAGLGQGHDEREQTLNELLVQMDGFSPNLGVVVMAATNRPDILDPALLRAGRFDRHVTLDRPDVDDRLEILKIHAAAKRLSDPESDLPHVARQTSGFTGADLANVLNEAALLAVRERARTIDRHILEDAVDRVLAGPKRKGQLISADERRWIAYHEAGHAVVAAALDKTANLQKLSLVARGRGVGHLALLADDTTVVTRSDMEAQVMIAMAGYAAEELEFGQPSTGSEQDLERATTTARDMAGRYGMSAHLGPVRVLSGNREVFLGRDYLEARDVSQPTLERLDDEVRRVLEEQKEAAKSILVSNRKVLDTLAGDLVAHETLYGPALQTTLSAVVPAATPEGTTKPRSPVRRAPSPPRPSAAHLSRPDPPPPTTRAVPPRREGDERGAPAPEVPSEAMSSAPQTEEPRAPEPTSPVGTVPADMAPEDGSVASSPGRPAGYPPGSGVTGEPPRRPSPRWWERRPPS